MKIKYVNKVVYLSLVFFALIQTSCTTTNTINYRQSSNLIEINEDFIEINVRNNNDTDITINYLTAVPNLNAYKLIKQYIIPSHSEVSLQGSKPHSFIEIINGTYTIQSKVKQYNLNISVNNYKHTHKITTIKYIDPINLAYFFNTPSEQDKYKNDSTVMTHAYVKYNEKDEFIYAYYSEAADKVIEYVLPKKLYKEYGTKNSILYDHSVFTPTECKIYFERYGDEYKLTYIVGLLDENSLNEYKEQLRQEELQKIQEQEKQNKLKQEKEAKAIAHAKKLETHVFINGAYYPKLSENTQVEHLDFKHKNFQDNNPYGFSKDVYYVRDNSNNYLGEVFQWITPNECLFIFGSKYSRISSDIYWNSTAYLIFDSKINNYPFDTFVCRYIDAYQYETALGSLNTIPMFEIVFP